MGLDEDEKYVVISQDCNKEMNQKWKPDLQTQILSVFLSACASLHESRPGSHGMENERAKEKEGFGFFFWFILPF